MCITVGIPPSFLFIPAIPSGKTEGIGDCPTTTARVHAAIFWIEPRIELPVTERHTDSVVVGLHLWEDLEADQETLMANNNKP